MEVCLWIGLVLYLYIGFWEGVDRAVNCAKTTTRIYTPLVVLWVVTFAWPLFRAD